MLILISVSNRTIQLITVPGDDVNEVDAPTGRFSKWADPADESWSRETAAEDRRARILETMYGGRV